MHTHVVIQLKFLFILILSQIALLRGSNFCHVQKTTILIISLQIKLIFRFTIFWFERVYLTVGKYAKGFRMDLYSSHNLGIIAVTSETQLFLYIFVINDKFVVMLSNSINQG